MTIYRTERQTAAGAEGSAVAPELFGADHWRLLLLIAEAAPRGGTLDTVHLRISNARRPAFSPNPRHPGEDPTQIKAGPALRGDGRFGVAKLSGHDDIDCLEDLEQAGLIEVEGPTVVEDRFIGPDGGEVLDAAGLPLDPFSPPGEQEAAIFACARWTLTSSGATAAAALSSHRDAGRTLHSFVAPTASPLHAAASPLPVREEPVAAVA